MNAREKRAVARLIEIVDKLAPPDKMGCVLLSPRRARAGVPCGRNGRWDGGKVWARRDHEINEAVRKAKEVMR